MVDVTSKTNSPMHNCRFALKFPGKKDPVALVSKMSKLTASTEALAWRCGGDSNSPRMLAGKTKYEPITLERGLSLDSDFEDWANLVNNFDTHLAETDNDFRKDISIEIMDLDGRVVLKYNIYSCWVSEFTAIPEFDANANAVAIQSIKIENEGWVREK